MIDPRSHFKREIRSFSHERTIFPWIRARQHSVSTEGKDEKDFRGKIGPEELNRSTEKEMRARGIV